MRRVSPARRQVDMTGGSQLIELRIPINLYCSLEVLQMSRRTFSTAIRAVEIDRRRRIGAAPRPVVSGVDP